MSRSIIHNLTADTLHPGPKLVITQQADGLQKGSMEFYCRKGDMGRPILQNLLRLGVPIATLYPQIGIGFPYLYLTDFEARDEPGGYTVVSCNFEGITPSEGDFQFEGASVTYTRNSSLRDESIFNNKNFINQVPAGFREAILLGSLGAARKKDGETFYPIILVKDDSLLTTLTDSVHQFWWDYIVTQKNTTYLRPSSEWTKSATGRGKLRSADLKNLGKIDEPAGDPAAPEGDTWLLTGATENIQVSGEGANSFSLTWTSGDWEKKVYKDE